MDERVSSVELQDLAHKAEGLLQCLQFVMDHGEYKNYPDEPHAYLVEVIRDTLTEISKQAERI